MTNELKLSRIRPNAEHKCPGCNYRVSTLYILSADDDPELDFEDGYPINANCGDCIADLITDREYTICAPDN